LERDNQPRLNLPKRRRDSLVEIVPISHGCLSSCTFCKTKHARGQLYSYPVEDIVRHVSSVAAEGVQEIWLTSQDCSAYGFDIGKTLPELLEALCSINREFKIRVGMGNPDHFLEILDDFIAVMRNPKIYRFAHVPVQAGNNEVLQAMKREYTVEQYEYIIERLRESFPLINITTDIICGYPTETEDAFEDTLALMRRTPTDNVNISRYWPRPGTPAAKLKPLAGGEVKRRTRLVTQAYNEMALRLNSRWKHWTGPVRIMEAGKGSSWVARNDYYKQVVLKVQDLSPGDLTNIRVADTTAVDLRAG
ncbi:MAG: tRNA (N(6)-L-threonylcarbamoyladenosine(37)-C(2))-methylthiotransferase, partial [Bdellovibrionales bacterium]|nr:tRNA (N(6)-L-threonylcarbamoyladenosine(37)-C(2))-methylthiotransferase [Bdellovibrionales bacterium]